ncbi:MAG TPA: hypothetical protein VGB14_08170 [Acidimicrobiales bacterium]
MSDGAPGDERGGRGRGGVLLLRVWVEATAPPDVRARVLAAEPDRSACLLNAGVAGVDEVVATVRRWLEELASPEPSAGDAPATRREFS